MNLFIFQTVVMRNLKKVDSSGVAISKEYGFVTFKEHEDALKALRTINNNPNIFNSNKVNLFKVKLFKLKYLFQYYLLVILEANSCIFYRK